MAGVDPDAVRRMTGTLFIERGFRSPGSTRFWGLLVLAAVIASAGVVGDSTATVIGAMIVAPLMTPILGCALALVLARRRQVTRCLLLVIGGALAVVAIGLLLGWIVTPPRRLRLQQPGLLTHQPPPHPLLAAPLTAGTVTVARDRSPAADARPVAEKWAATGKWQIASVEARNGIVVIGVLGLPPQPALRAALDEHGMRDADLELHLVGGRTQWCPADTDTCTVRVGGRS
ncbi:DUF389 domain-containing protein [Streptomyces sp. NPDC048445]|uniref:DUF389 domain-containing protein n=1 Tax=Streptomyces sp. NPDC048445 TaxID=3365553 RepID=UPI003717081E